jgi:hypothetical protein
MAASGDAFAASTTFKDMSDNIMDASSGLNGLISTVCWVGGAGLGVAGIFKLKQHVDSPAQVAMKDGLVRLGAGGGLLAFPFVQEAMQGSISNGKINQLNASQLKMQNTTVFK